MTGWLVEMFAKWNNYNWYLWSVVIILLIIFYPIFYNAMCILPSSLIDCIIHSSSKVCIYTVYVINIIKKRQFGNSK